VTGSYERDSKHSGFMKGREFHSYLCDLASQKGLCSIELVI